jgi:hypothetical protein
VQDEDCLKLSPGTAVSALCELKPANSTVTNTYWFDAAVIEVQRKRHPAGRASRLLCIGCEGHPAVLQLPPPHPAA